MSKKHNKIKVSYDDYYITSKNHKKHKKKNKHKTDKIYAKVSKDVHTVVKGVSVDGTVTFNLPSGKKVSKFINGSKSVFGFVGGMLDMLSRVSVETTNDTDKKED